MKKTIRVLALVLVLALVACFAMTGCGKDKGKDTGSIDMENLSEMTLEYWCLGPAVQKRDAEVEAAANELLQKDIKNTSVHYTWIPAAEIVDKVTRALAANENIDALWMGYSFSNAIKEAWCRDETFEDLTAYADTYLKDYYAFVGDAEREALKIDDKDFFIIGWQGLAYNRHGIWVSTDLLEAMDYDPDQWVKDVERLAYAAYKPEDRNIETETAWMDFWYEYCDRMDKSGIYKEDTVLGGSINCNAPISANSFRSGYGYVGVGTYFNFKIGQDVNAADFRLSSLLTPDEDLQVINKNRYELSAKWYDNGWIRKDVASSKESGLKSKFEQYKDWQYDKLNSHNLLDIPKDSFLIRENGKRDGFKLSAAYIKPTYGLDPGKSTMSCVPFTVKENGGLERSLIFQNYLFTEACTDYYRTVIYGREGIEWDWDADGKTATWYMGNGSQGAADWEYGKAAWYFGNCLYALPTSNGGFDPNYYYMLVECEKNMWASPYVNFAFDASDPEITMIMSNLSSINKEYTDMLQSGYLGLAGWEAKYNEYVEKMKTNGLEKLEAEVLKQVQKFAKDHNITTGWDKGY